MAPSDRMIHASVCSTRRMADDESGRGRPETRQRSQRVKRPSPDPDPSPRDSTRRRRRSAGDMAAAGRSRRQIHRCALYPAVISRAFHSHIFTLQSRRLFSWSWLWRCAPNALRRGIVMVCAVVELDCPRPWPVARADAGDDALVPAWGNDDLAPGAWTSILVNIPEFIAPLRLNVLSDVLSHTEICCRLQCTGMQRAIRFPATCQTSETLGAE